MRQAIIPLHGATTRILLPRVIVYEPMHPLWDLAIHRLLIVVLDDAKLVVGHVLSVPTIHAATPYPRIAPIHLVWRT